MKKIVLLILVLAYSCEPQTKKEEYYYAILNNVIENESKIRDSIFIFEHEPKKIRTASFIRYLKDLNSNTSNKLKAFLYKNSIFLEEELNHLNEQNSKYLPFDKNKIKVNKLKYLPRPKNLKDTIEYMKSKYTKYTFHMPKPLFTKNEKYALIDYYSKGGALYLLIYENHNGKWKEIDRLSYVRF